MPFWNRFIKKISGGENRPPSLLTVNADSSRYGFVDAEIGVHDNKIHDIGAIKWDGSVYHSDNKQGLSNFLKDVVFVCGHNIINHDAKYLFGPDEHNYILVDTLYLSPLLFPEHPYHHLVKDYKLVNDDINNPVSDCKKARDLLMDEVVRWKIIPEAKQMIFSTLLQHIDEFRGFLIFVNAKHVSYDTLPKLIRSEYGNKICQRADIENAIHNHPAELAYALALIDTTDYRSITPPWVVHNFPNVENLMQRLRHTKCSEGCPYCNKELDIHVNLNRFFGFDRFRTYHGEPLQEDAVRAVVEEALLYLAKIGAMKLEGGFLVLYNAMDIRRIKDTRSRYKQEDYRMLSEFYMQKIQQIHIVGEYANLMVQDYNAALQYVSDYFQMDYRRFILKYFKGERISEIERNVTPEKYNTIFGSLSEKQMKIISDKETRCIVVAAGPGSGKTRVLVHKLASLLLLEDVKHEQLLMLTFSRAAATEFKLRLLDLIGNAAHFVEIKTFHSYCFDLLGRIGSLDSSKGVVTRAAHMIASREVEPSRIAKTVLVIDEAQDMSAEEYALVHALMAFNEEMRVIAVGDDDQNIFEFRGSDSRYMTQLLNESGARLIEMTDNYRSATHLVAFANTLAGKIAGRMKTHPIVSVNRKDGAVYIRHHISNIMYQPLVDDLLNHRQRGSTCILTQTNEEAVILVALLRKHGLKSRLMQNMDGFRFYNLAEVRMFLKQIDRECHLPVIPDDIWEWAKQKT